MRSARRIALVGLLLLVAPDLLRSRDASAHENELGFEADVRRAQLIFEGEVVGVDYKASIDSGRDGGDLPHTFVTFAIERIFKGRTDASRLTLRFMGGAGPDGEFLVVGDHPLFDPGDREILLVEGNGRRACPLVHCDEGRFRLIAGVVFDDDGQEVVQTPEGAVALGRFHTLRDVLTHRLPSGLVLGRVDVVDPDEEGRIPEQRSPGPQLSAEAFRELLREAVDRLHTPEELARLAPVPSADIREDFAVRPSPVRAFEHDTPPRPPRIRSLEDLFEERLLRRNDDDPVLSERASRLIRKLQQLEWERRSRKGGTRR